MSQPAPRAGHQSASPRQVLSQGNWQAAPAPAGTRDLTGDDLVLIPFTLSTAGTLDATVDWSVQSNDVEFGIHQGTCTLESLGSGACTVFLVSGKANKPVTVSRVGATAGNYTLIIVDYGPARESGTFQVSANY